MYELTSMQCGVRLYGCCITLFWCNTEREETQHGPSFSVTIWLILIRNKWRLKDNGWMDGWKEGWIANKIQLNPSKCAACALCRPWTKTWPSLHSTLHDDDFETLDLDKTIDPSRWLFFLCLLPSFLGQYSSSCWMALNMHRAQRGRATSQ